MRSAVAKGPSGVIYPVTPNGVEHMSLLGMLVIATKGDLSGNA